MKLRIATFNVENLFSRPKAMNNPTWKEGQSALDAAGRLNVIFNQDVYSPANKKEMLKLLAAHGLLATRPQSEFLDLRKIRGKLFTVPATGAPSIVANGRGDWVGWVSLKTDAIRDAAIENTARVIAAVDPDILVTVEVEDRPAVRRFHDTVLLPMLKAQGGTARPYPNDMVIVGNDPRGINVGILSRFPIARMRSHITDTTAGKPTFSRDCPEYVIDLGPGKELVILPNHFASKGSDKTGARRKVQSAAVAGIYAEVRKTHDLVLVASDLNDHPAGGSLDALLNTELKDAMSLPVYQGLPGTYEQARADQKIDFLLCSPKLAAGVKAVDVERRGFYAPTKWTSFPGIDKTTKDRNQASDHHCVWADVEV
jgi:endonuclease/exonuclease/phosphatase family metal-dependent hydrolase